MCTSEFHIFGLLLFTEINECATGTTPCSLNARCVDLPEGYQSTCNPGFTGDGQTCTGLNVGKLLNLSNVIT